MKVVLSHLGVGSSWGQKTPVHQQLVLQQLVGEPNLVVPVCQNVQSSEILFARCVTSFGENKPCETTTAVSEDTLGLIGT